MRLGVGELTVHLRRQVEGVRQRIECGAPHGCVTAVRADVTCKDCDAISRSADHLAEVCGCRIGAVHTGVARAIYEIAGHFG